LFGLAALLTVGAMIWFFSSGAGTSYEVLYTLSLAIILL
jgi:hypothetical protein